MKKVEVVLISKKAGDVYLIRGEGDLIPCPEFVTDQSQTAIFHAKHYSQDARANWYTVNLWTGLFVSDGTTKRKCLEELEKKKSAYLSMLRDPARAEFFYTKHEELEKLKKA